MDGYAFVLNIVDGISEIRGTWTGCLFDSFGEESFKNELYCVFRFCHCRLYFMSECLNRLIVSEFGFVLQLGKIVASIEQKPVSLNDIVTYGALIKNERDY